MKSILEPQTHIEFQPVSTSKMRIGIMGGTFNPVHLGHLNMAEQVRKKLDLDEIWFIPNNIPPHKQMDSNITTKDRLAMLSLATRSNPHFRIMLLEILRGGVSYTVDTLRYLKKRAPRNQYYLIMGSDEVESFPKWKDPEIITRLATLVGVKRPNYQVESNYPMIWVDAPSLEISSSYIRQNVAMGQSIRYLVPEKVWQYIQERGLYLGEDFF